AGNLRHRPPLGSPPHGPCAEGLANRSDRRPSSPVHGGGARRAEGGSPTKCPLNIIPNPVGRVSQRRNPPPSSTTESNPTPSLPISMGRGRVALRGHIRSPTAQRVPSPRHGGL